MLLIINVKRSYSGALEKPPVQKENETIYFVKKRIVGLEFITPE